MANLSVGGGNGSDVNHSFVQMVRGSTAINIGDARCYKSKKRTPSAKQYKVQGVMLHRNGCLRFPKHNKCYDFIKFKCLQQ